MSARLMICPDCGWKVSKIAPACQECGRPFFRDDYDKEGSPGRRSPEMAAPTSFLDPVPLHCGRRFPDRGRRGFVGLRARYHWNRRFPCPCGFGIGVNRLRRWAILGDDREGDKGGVGGKVIFLKIGKSKLDGVSEQWR